MIWSKKFCFIFGFLVASSFFSNAQSEWYDHNLLIGGYNLGKDMYKIDTGVEFENSENMLALYYIRSHSNAFLLAEADFLGGWNQQTHFKATSIDSIKSNNFQLFNILLAFYSNRFFGDNWALGGFFSIDATLREASTNPSSGTPGLVASPAGMGFGIGLSLMIKFGDRIVTNHNIGVSAIGNAQNEPNWIARNRFYLGSLTYPLNNRFALQGYLNVEKIKFIDQVRNANDFKGDLLHVSVRFGLGIQLGSDGLLD